MCVSVLKRMAHKECDLFHAHDIDDDHEKELKKRQQATSGKTWSSTSERCQAQRIVDSLTWQLEFNWTSY